MDNKLSEILNEAKATIETMIKNIENYSCLKFYAGKLSLLTKTISTCIDSKN